jgi:hypothetical protein
MLKLVSHVNSVARRDYASASATVLDPTEVTALVQGEWLSLDSAGELVRADSPNNNAKMLFTPKGSYDAQALGKVSVIQSQDFEVDTDMFTGTTWAIGDLVGIDQQTVDGTTRSVFALHSGLTSGTDYIYGVVTKAPADNSDLLRVQVQSPRLS